MTDPNILPKRIRRCEVANLILTEEVAEIRCVLRAVYESILLICRRLPESTTGADADPVEMLMLPPWLRNPETADMLPPPLHLDLKQIGCENLRQRLDHLSHDEQSAIRTSQIRVFELRTKLKKFEADREVRLKSEREVSR